MNMLKQEILDHGVVKISNQNMTHEQQMDLTQKMGEVVLIPEAIRGPFEVPGYPNMISVSNYWINGTWKAEQPGFGQFWHKDVNYLPFDKGYVLSMLYADEFEEGIVGGETAFINGCSLRRRLPQDIEEIVVNKSLFMSGDEIPNFKKILTKEERDTIPSVTHKIIFRHPGNDKECIFSRKLIPPHPDDILTTTLLRLWDFMQDPRYVMKQYWKPGDIVIYDNYGVFHRAMPMIMTRKKRSLYRSQIRLKVDMSKYKENA